MERKVCFILGAGTWGREGGFLSTGRLALTDSRQELLQTAGGGYLQKQHSQL